jgi:hypothetical protein
MMSRAGPGTRRLLAALFFAGWSGAAAAADPLTLILLRLLRDQVITSAAQAAYEGAQRRDGPPGPTAQPLYIPPAPYDLEDGRLRALIDEGFVQLSAAQRDEVFASLKRILADPQHAAARPVIIQELALKASATRQAHERLSRLTAAEKRTVAEQAREEYERMPVEERAQMLQVLRSGALPIPRDLNELILAEFGRVQAASAAVAAPAPSAR